MAQDYFQYEKMVESALRGVVREALIRAAKDGLRGNHHFYIGFASQMPGVTIPDYLRAKYPEEMTIVVQHQFENLEITDDKFSISLSFQKQWEKLEIPFVAIRSFADPSVNFALEFAVPEAKAEAPRPLPVALEAPKPTEKTSAEVVTLDSFRKR
jgi:hypothetical protein